MSIITTQKRIEAIASEICVYWAQSGKPARDEDLKGIQSQAAAIETDVTKWLSPKEIHAAIRNCRMKSRTVPAPSSINESAEWIRNNRKAEKPAALQFPEKTPTKLDQWQELAFARVFPGNPHASRSAWVTDMLGNAPTPREVDGLIRWFIAMAPSTRGPHRKMAIQANARTLAEKRPYGLDYDGILRKCREILAEIELPL